MKIYDIKTNLELEVPDDIALFDEKCQEIAKIGTPEEKMIMTLCNVSQRFTYINLKIGIGITEEYYNEEVQTATEIAKLKRDPKK